MLSLFRTQIDAPGAHFWLLALRVLAGSFMLTHGYPKFEQLISGEEIAFYNWMGMGPTVSLTLAVMAEFLCALLLIPGVATRLASIPLIITMMVAAFGVHADDPFRKKEFALLYLLIFITLLVFGAGNYSVDRLISKR